MTHFPVYTFSVEPQELANILRHEQNHFYYTSLHRLILGLLPKGSPEISILDAGCGTGLLAEKLKVFGRVTAVDISSEACALTQNRGIETTQCPVTALPFEKNSFDVITSIDVLSHKMVDDEKALLEFLRTLKPGGQLCLRLSAIPWLKNSHDRFIHTGRRYSKAGLQEKLDRHGFIVRKFSGTGLFLIPAALLTHVIDALTRRRNMKSGVTELPPLVNMILRFLFYCEEKWILKTGIGLPIGLGWIILAEKPRAYPESHAPLSETSSSTKHGIDRYKQTPLGSPQESIL